MKTQVRRLTLFFSILIIFSSFVFANLNWVNYGNHQELGRSTGISDVLDFNRNLFFGSNYPFGDTNFTVIADTLVTSRFTPIIWNGLNGQNIIMLFTNSYINKLDNNGQPEDTFYYYPTNANIYGNPIAYSEVISGSYRHFVIFMTNLSAKYYINMVEIDDYGALSLYDTINLSFYNYTSVPTGEIFGNSGSAPYIWIAANTNGKITSIEINTKTFTNQTGGANFTGFGYNALIGVNKGLFGDVNGDNYLDLVQVGYDFMKIFNTNPNISATTCSVGLATNTGKITKPAIGNIGTYGGNPEIIVVESDEDNTAASPRINIYDANCNLLFTEIFTATYHASPSNPTVCDIDHDGLNEVCVVITRNMTTSVPAGDFSQLYCYNRYYTKIINTQFDRKLVNPTTLSCGEYEDSNDYSELMIGGSIWSIYNSTKNLSAIYNFSGLIHTTTAYLPVEITLRDPAFKDIFQYSISDYASYITLSSGAGTCGDGICQVNENLWNCFQDCANPNLTGLAGNIENNDQCLNDSWCISGVCDELSHTCVGLPPESLCTEDNQCSSGECTTSGLCTKEDNVAIILSAVESLGFRSWQSKLLFGLLLILVMVGICAGGLAYIGGVTGAVIGSILGSIIGILINIFVFGYIAIFIFISIIIIISIIALILYFISSPSGG